MKHKDISKYHEEKPLPVQLMNEFGISQQGIARQLGMSPNKVNNALRIERFDRVHHGDMVLIRLRIEKMLRAAGWEGNSRTLWSEYDTSLVLAAAA